MKLPLKESAKAKYLHIDPDNIVHVLMPVVSGTRIGLDNTCKAVYSLQEFFGKSSHSNKKGSLKNELLAYKEALESDLSLLGGSKEHALLMRQKQERLKQIYFYLSLLVQLENHSELNCLDNGYPSYPRPLESLMQDRVASNLYSMVLRPKDEDAFLRSEGANPTFSVAHKSLARNRVISVSKLQQELMNAYAPLRYESKNVKSQVIQAVLRQLPQPHVPVHFAHLQQILTNTVQAFFNESVDFTQTQQKTPMTQATIDTEIGLQASTARPTEYIESLLGYCAPNLFDDKVESPFNALTTAEGWSIATQFLFGIANIYGVSYNKVDSNTNFGQILDSDAPLSQDLAQTLAKAQKANQCIEDTALSWMNAHRRQLQLKTQFDSNDVATIKKTFAKYYAEIKESPHFDEFFILDTHKKGSFFTHQGTICASFAEFACSPLLNLSTPLIQPLEKARSQANRLSTEIPHQNHWVLQGEVEVNTTAMDYIELHALYESINTYKEAKLKNQLLKQLKQERPDYFKSLDAKPFLQHVAYGEQNEAEALLQKDPEFAQELLKANNIPFTDYSGRTFTCTAYEYAYWAKDSHMQRMLEKYILLNEETRLFILQRVKDIEEPTSSNLSRPLFLAENKPQGLHYTTKDKQGVVIQHKNAGFDFTPLKTALKHYIKDHNKGLIMRNSDYGALSKIWIEEVGRAQCDVPAHIAHEYCHPDRSFEEVNKNNELLNASNPDNLKRQLKFINFNKGEIRGVDDVWFDRNSCVRNSELGVLFGITCTAQPWVSSLVCGTPLPPTKAAEINLDVLTTIDKVRSNDRKQSLLNLMQISNLKTSQSHGP